MFISAVVMGFVGSLHCVSMCSPLAMAVTNVSRRILITRSLYNLGRITTYAILGAIVGSFGWLIPFSKFQHAFSIALGVLLIAVAFIGLKHIEIPILNALLGGASRAIKMRFSEFLAYRNYQSTFVLGMLNGLLPCGLTSVALAYCLTLGNAGTSFVYMFLFGLGTLPAMLGMTRIYHWIVQRLHLSFRKVTMVMLIASGCLLIARVFLPHEHTDLSATEPDIVICK